MHWTFAAFVATGSQYLSWALQQSSLQPEPPWSSLPHWLSGPAEKVPKSLQLKIDESQPRSFAHFTMQPLGSVSAAHALLQYEAWAVQHWLLQLEPP
jgi:hypothetical protein